MFSDDESRGARRPAAGKLRNATGASMTGVVVSIAAEAVEDGHARPTAATTTVAGATMRVTARESSCSATFTNLRVAPGESVAFSPGGIDAGGAEMLAITVRPLFDGETR